VVKLLGVQERQDSSELVLDLLGDRVLLADETGEALKLRQDTPEPGAGA
jgi:hypothetical protein